MKKASSNILLFSKIYRTMTSGWQGAPSFRREIRPGTGFRTGDFVEEKFGEVYRTTTPTSGFHHSHFTSDSQHTSQTKTIQEVFFTNSIAESSAKKVGTAHSKSSKSQKKQRARGRGGGGGGHSRE